MEYGSESDSDQDEQPQIVVLKKGDLAAEEVEQEKKRIEKGIVSNSFVPIPFLCIFVSVQHTETVMVVFAIIDIVM